MSECLGIDGAYQHYDVNIGWYPFRALRHTVVRSAPGAGKVLASVAPGQGLGVQSARNPDCRPDPPLRQSVLGTDGHRYVWAYKRSGAKTGWVRADDIRYQPDKNHAPLTGPAGVDFEVFRTKPTRGSKHGCGRKPRTPYRNRRVKSETLHLRYSPRGTSKHYLHKGDRVKLLIVNGIHGFAFVEVTKANPWGSARKGMRGWVHAGSLATL